MSRCESDDPYLIVILTEPGCEGATLLNLSGDLLKVEYFSRIVTEEPLSSLLSSFMSEKLVWPVDLEEDRLCAVIDARSSLTRAHLDSFILVKLPFLSLQLQAPFILATFPDGVDLLVKQISKACPSDLSRHQDKILRNRIPLTMDDQRAWAKLSLETLNRLEKDRKLESRALLDLLALLEMLEVVPREAIEPLIYRYERFHPFLDLLLEGRTWDIGEENLSRLICSEIEYVWLMGGPVSDGSFFCFDFPSKSLSLGSLLYELVGGWVDDMNIEKSIICGPVVSYILCHVFHISSNREDIDDTVLAGACIRGIFKSFPPLAPQVIPSNSDLTDIAAAVLSNSGEIDVDIRREDDDIIFDVEMVRGFLEPGEEGAVDVTLELGTAICPGCQAYKPRTDRKMRVVNGQSASFRFRTDNHTLIFIDMDDKDAFLRQADDHFQNIQWRWPSCLMKGSRDLELDKISLLIDTADPRDFLRGFRCVEIRKGNRRDVCLSHIPMSRCWVSRKNAITATASCLHSHLNKTITSLLPSVSPSNLLFELIKYKRCSYHPPSPYYFICERHGQSHLVSPFGLKQFPSFPREGYESRCDELAREDKAAIEEVRRVRNSAGKEHLPKVKPLTRDLICSLVERSLDIAFLNELSRKRVGLSESLLPLLKGADDATLELYRSLLKEV